MSIALLSVEGGGSDITVAVEPNMTNPALCAIRLRDGGILRGSIVLDVAAADALHAALGAYLSPLWEARLEELKASAPEEEEPEPSDIEGQQWRGQERDGHDRELMAAARELK